MIILSSPETRSPPVAAVFDVASVAPPSLGVTGGSITVYGDNFQGSNTVLVGGTAATSVVTVDVHTITCTAPAKSGGSYDVTVQQAGFNDAVLVNGLTYTIPASQNNVAYKAGGNAWNTCDIYAGPVANSPICIVLHAGGWQRTRHQLKSAVAFWGQLRDAGFCAVNADYITTDIPGYNRTLPALDIQAIVTFFRDPTNAALYNGDHTKVYVVGHSAGAHLGLLGAIKGTADADGSCPDLLGLWSPPCTLSRIYNSFAKSAVQAFIGGLPLAGHEALYAQYSPADPTCIYGTFPTTCPIRLVGGQHEITDSQDGIDVGNYTDLVAQAIAHSQTIITRYWVAPATHHNYTGLFDQGSNLACDDHQEMINWLLSGGVTYNFGSVDRDSVGSLGGTLITLTCGAGQTFSAGSTVKIGGTAATSVTVVNSTTITCKVPPQPAGLTARDIDGGASPFRAYWADIVVSTSLGVAYWTLTKRLTYWTSRVNTWRYSNFEEYTNGPIAFTGPGSTPYNANPTGAGKVVVGLGATYSITPVSGTKLVYSSTTSNGIDDLHLSSSPVMGAQAGDPGYPSAAQTDVVGGNGRWHRHYFQMPQTTLTAIEGTPVNKTGQVKLMWTRTGGAIPGFFMLACGNEFGGTFDARFMAVTDYKAFPLVFGPPIVAATWHEVQSCIWRDATLHIGYGVVWYDGNIQCIMGTTGGSVLCDVPANKTYGDVLGNDENKSAGRGTIFGLFTQHAQPPGTLVEHFADACVVADGFIDPVQP